MDAATKCFGSGTASNGNGRCLCVQRARALKSDADAEANGRFRIPRSVREIPNSMRTDKKMMLDMPHVSERLSK